MKKFYKFELCTTYKQELILDKYCFVYRLAYNSLLDELKNYDELKISRSVLLERLKDLKNSYLMLNTVPNSLLRQAVSDLEYNVNGGNYSKIGCFSKHCIFKYNKNEAIIKNNNLVICNKTKFEIAHLTKILGSIRLIKVFSKNGRWFIEIRTEFNFVDFKAIVDNNLEILNDSQCEYDTHENVKNRIYNINSRIQKLNNVLTKKQYNSKSYRGILAKIDRLTKTSYNIKSDYTIKYLNKINVPVTKKTISYLTKRFFERVGGSG
jgi:hypothetical protein